MVFPFLHVTVAGSGNEEYNDTLCFVILFAGQC